MSPLINHVSGYCEWVPIAKRSPLPGISSPQRAFMRLIVSSSEYCCRQLKKRRFSLPVLAGAGSLTVLGLIVILEAVRTGRIRHDRSEEKVGLFSGHLELLSLVFKLVSRFPFGGEPADLRPDEGKAPALGALFL